MHLASWRNSSVLALVFLIGILVGVLGAPLWRMVLIHLYSPKYADLTYLCDSAMRAHDIERARTAAEPSADQVSRLRQAELALIDCQDYDILQKRLLNLGLRESELGLMRLRAIEADAAALSKVVDAHEIRN